MRPEFPMEITIYENSLGEGSLHCSASLTQADFPQYPEHSMLSMSTQKLWLVLGVKLYEKYET